MEPLVSADWLAERLRDPSLRLLDTAWYMPVHGRNNHADYRAGRIPGARFFDIDGVAADAVAGRGLPHMLPSEQGFAAAMDALGITNDTTVVLYDHLGMFSAPRVWWTFKVFGHDKVAVLQGGLPAWKARGLPLESEPPSDADMFAASRACAAPPPTTAYRAKLDSSKVRTIDDMLANISSQAEQVMDARSPGRFVGTEPEPRAGLRGGHIPGARSLPFPVLLEAGAYKPADQLEAAFRAAGLDPSGKPIVGSCGSGLTACILALGLYQVNGRLAAIYDGSWSEYGARNDVPVSTLSEDP
ncbi:hypothetical protein GPECTOR_17g867 [Gonium pectorale]|uniref:Sulfurtransferase n=1 Tax=Gonium pectorale TaxID=33097 RepID=A0A150GK61_GONPE|nr:hypothetical protein GPECTOR_17g867 [Gonium pectorale]|eukprot:KXZ50229.1 hypothetical protein GPECTOR_17g867 [Gonium pectorale]